MIWKPSLEAQKPCVRSFDENTETSWLTAIVVWTRGTHEITTESQVID